MKTKTFFLTGLTVLNMNSAINNCFAQCNIKILPPQLSVICSGDSAVLTVKGNGNALLFDGTDDYVSIPDLKWTPTTFTVEWWLYPTSYLNYCCNFAITGGGGWGTFVFHLENNGGVYVGTDGSTRFTPSNIPSGTVELNKWQHFAFTFNNGTAKFYKNGSLLASKTGMTNPTTWNGFNISSSSSGNVIKGSVDEMRIWDVERTQSEIQTSMNTTLSLSLSGLKAYWSMDEDTGTVINDLTGNGFTGTLYNGTTREPSAAPISDGTLSYSWTPSTGLNDTTTPTVIAKPITTTTYIVTATGNCGTGKDSVTVAVGTAIDASSTSVCVGDSVILKAKGVMNTGYALNFSGGQYVTIGNTALNNISTQITVEGWVNINSASDVYNYMVSNDRDCCGGTYRGYSLWVVQGYPRFQVYDTTNVYSNYKILQDSIKISAGTWHHLAGTFDGDSLRLYVNGQLAATTAYKGRIGTPATFNLYLGGMGFGSGSGFSLKGMLDEIRIWNYARTQTEIQSAMKSSVPSSAIGLLAYWQFEEGTGTKANDATANAFHGTINGATYVSTTAPIGSVFTWTPSSELNTAIGDSVVAKPTSTTTYKVTASGGICPANDSITITVNTSPVATITGNTSVCKGKSTTLTASGGTNYQWNTGDSTSAITLTPLSDSLFSVTVTSNCGIDSLSKMVNVWDNPIIPTVTNNGTLLSSSSSTGNQWYRNDTLLTGATNQTYTATISGNYTVVVTDNNGCAATSSDVSINVGINDQHQAPSNQFQVYPNPSDGNFELEILNSKSGINNAVIKIYDVLGREIYKSEITNQSFKIQNLKSKIDKGVYFLQLTTDEGVWNERIIVQ